jgi:hypothetical protein
MQFGEFVNVIIATGNAIFKCWLFKFVIMVV